MMYIQWGDSALMVAAKSDVTRVVKELVKGGADLNQQNNVCCCACWLLCVVFVQLGRGGRGIGESWLAVKDSLTIPVLKAGYPSTP